MSEIGPFRDDETENLSHPKPSCSCNLLLFLVFSMKVNNHSAEETNKRQHLHITIREKFLTMHHYS